VPLSGQIAQARKVETIANNIANANTAGFKKDRLAFKEHLTALTKGADSIDLPRKEWSPQDFYRSQGSENAFVKVDGSYIDFEQGPLNPTGNPLDFGLNGKGFFEVLTPNGIRFMRKGNFSLNQSGEVVTSSGFKVLSAQVNAGKKNGETNDNAIENRVLKVPTNSPFSVSKEGDVFNSQGKIGKISLVEFRDLQALRKEGHSLFINNGTDNVRRDKIATTVNQGFVEGSNVNAIREMSELISAHRHFENIQKAINTYDAMSKQAVNDIASF
jgi:flagellar basal-body rod protein FlgG